MLINLLLALAYLFLLYLLLICACRLLSRCLASAITPWRSLILVARNQALWIEELLNRLAAKDGLEIVVIDDLSSDDTFPILERLQRKRFFSLLRSSELGCRPLELGLPLCHGKLVYCVFLRD